MHEMKKQIFYTFLTNSIYNKFFFFGFYLVMYEFTI